MFDGIKGIFGGLFVTKPGHTTDLEDISIPAQLQRLAQNRANEVGQVGGRNYHKIGGRICDELGNELRLYQDGRLYYPGCSVPQSPVLVSPKPKLAAYEEETIDSKPPDIIVIKGDS